MLQKPLSLIYFFRWLWIVLALILVSFVISQNIFTARTLVYSLDFTRPINSNTDGWYPQQRLIYDSPSGFLEIKGEPLYLKAYVPVQFSTVTVKGTVVNAGTTMRLGLLQTDNSWFFKDINSGDINVTFMLNQAKVQRRQIELILSLPIMTSTSTVAIANNWQLIFQR